MENNLSGRSPSTPPNGKKSGTRARCQVVAGLAAIALVQPLLELFGSNPEFFVYQRASRVTVVLFAVVLTAASIGVPTLIEMLAAATRRPAVIAVAHLLTVGGLGGIYALVTVRKANPESDLLAISAMAVAAIGLGLAEARYSVVARSARLLAFTPVIFLGLFVWVSPTSRLIWGDEASAVDVPVGNPLPVVMVMLDELPLGSLLDSKGELNAQRFPNFAELSAGSIWYRNARSNASGTTLSVPATLTGLTPAGDSVPTSIDHPRNLFTLLGETYDLEVHEEVTALCPASLCGDDSRVGSSADAPGGGAPEDAADGAGPVERGDLQSLLTDSWVVARHMVLPPGLRAHLPPMDASWGGFSGQLVEAPVVSVAEGRPEEEVPDPMAEFLEGIPEARAALTQGELLSDLANSVERRAQPTLWFTHASLPHHPWEVSPSGRRYTITSGSPGGLDGVWEERDDEVISGLQQHVMQTGYADRQIGEIIDALKSSGVWDEAVVIVTADHGIGFEPGRALRGPAAWPPDDLYRVPLFIRVPGVNEGVVDDRDAMLIDLLPSLVDLLDVDVDWEFDGRSLFEESPDERTSPEHPVPLDVGSPCCSRSFREVLDRNDAWIGSGGWDGVYMTAALAGYSGEPVSSFVVRESEVEWSLDQAPVLASLDHEGSYLPLMLTGKASSHSSGRFLVAVNGSVAGSGFVGPDGSYSALAAESAFISGQNSVRFLVPEAGGWWSPVLPVASGSGHALVGGGDDGVLTMPDGTSIDVHRQDSVRQVGIDRAVQLDGALAISGWAIDLDRGRVPDRVLLVVDGVLVEASERRLERGDIATRHDDDGLLGAGFELVLAGRHEPESGLAVLAVFDDVAIWRTVRLQDDHLEDRGPQDESRVKP